MTGKKIHLSLAVQHGGLLSLATKGELFVGPLAGSLGGFDTRAAARIPASLAV